MTREEAIKILEEDFDESIWFDVDCGIVFKHRWVQAYEMAISALREQETVTNSHQFETVTAVSWAVASGACDSCGHLWRCEHDTPFNPPEDTACMKKKRELLGGDGK